MPHRSQREQSRRIHRVTSQLICVLAVFACTTHVWSDSGIVRFAVVGEDSRPIPCRIHLTDSAGKFPKLTGHRFPQWRDHFACSGSAELELPTGAYEFTIERGPEHDRLEGKVSCRAGNETEISVRLKRIANLADAGWYAGDLHVHRPLDDIQLLMWAEDLHVAPVITWWNDRNLWEKQRLPENPVIQFDRDRYYHMLAGEDERQGGALMFFNLQRPLSITGAGREYPSPMQFVIEARKQDGAWIDIEKPFWWDVPVWLASGKVDSIGLANNHMCRSTMYEAEAWGKPRDAEAQPAPRGNGYWTQEIYYHILNCGIRLPPSAGSASGVLPNPVGYNRVYVHVNESFDYANWWDALKAGRSFVTNGPLLLAKADGHLPGHVFKCASTEPIDIELEASLVSNDKVPALEIIKNGRVDQTITVPDASYTDTLGTIRFERSGWFLIRAVTAEQRTFRFASTAPFYVEIGPSRRRISRESAQFFLDWVAERIDRVPRRLQDPSKLDEVLEPHLGAQVFWQNILDRANAE